MGLQSIADSSQDKNMSLYDRMGGDKFIVQLTQAFWDEMLENPQLERFFKHVPMDALKYHCIKFFRVVLGPKEDCPPLGDVMDFLLQTHSRLFRDLDLQMVHFDEVADCLVSSMESFSVDPGKAKEVMVIWNATRDIFEYGCAVAEQEKKMTLEEIRALPPASHKTMKTGMRVRLPDYTMLSVPPFLSEALSKAQSQTEPRAWACSLTDRFCSEGDKKIARIFMCQPYMAHYSYCIAFMQLAFMPKDYDAQQRLDVLDIVVYPRGKDVGPLSAKIFERMINGFEEVCHEMALPKHATQMAVNELKNYRVSFGNHSEKKVDGFKAPHILCRCQDTKKSSKTLKPLKPKKTGGKDDLHDDDTSDNDSSTGDLSCSSSRGGGEARGGGWMSFFSGQKKVIKVVR